MNLLIVFSILGLLIALGFLSLPTLAWLPIWFFTVYAVLNFGMQVPIPGSVQSLYLSLTILALAVYVLSDQERFETVKAQLHTFIANPRYTLSLYVVVGLLPLLLAGKIYSDLHVEVRAPTFARTVHPAPPGEMDFKGKKIDLIRGKNPLRELETSDPQKFREHVERGKVVYFQNCVFCHGDDLHGDGMFAHGLNPLPAEFSATTIGMLQEGYLFWRIAKGGPGLPDEAGPWSSAMPAWEKFLDEEPIWEVILYLYSHAGIKPRAEEEHH